MDFSAFDGSSRLSKEKGIVHRSDIFNLQAISTSAEADSIMQVASCGVRALTTAREELNRMSTGSGYLLELVPIAVAPNTQCLSYSRLVRCPTVSQRAIVNL